jgi:sugar lactone lactonase YvrE
MNRLHLSLLIVALLLQISVVSAAESNCTATGNLVPYCGLPNPEDLEVLPGGEGVIASDMHIAMTATGIAGQPGSLKWLNLKTRAVTVLYPGSSTPAGRSDWGDPACPGEIGAALLPHGMHLSQRKTGEWQLLVVNHGERESVEYFELVGKNKNWSLSWRGCVVPPPPNRLNDVAGLADGGMLVTTMHRLGNVEAKEAVNRAQQGENTGFLWRWTPGKGLSQQAGSESPRPNGVQVDAAGRYAYINTAAGGGEVRKLDLERAEVVAAVNVLNPDNASWTPDGKLLVTGMVAEATNHAACFANPGAPCPVAFNVYAIDPTSMHAEHLFNHSGSLGGGTVAVQFGADLLIGSCFGDRVIAVRNFFKPGSRNAIAAKQETTL